MVVVVCSGGGSCFLFSKREKEGRRGRERRGKTDVIEVSWQTVVDWVNPSSNWAAELLWRRRWRRTAEGYRITIDPSKMVWCKLANEREEERRGEGLAHTDGGCTTNGEPYRQRFERKRERESDESSREEGGAYAVPHVSISMTIYLCFLLPFYPFLSFFLLCPALPSLSLFTIYYYYLLFFLFLFYTNVTRNIRIYTYIFLYFDIYSLYSPFRISFAFIRLIFFLCSRDKQNCSPLTIFQLSYLINISFFHLVFPTLSSSSSSFRFIIIILIIWLNALWLVFKSTLEP